MKGKKPFLKSRKRIYHWVYLSKRKIKGKRKKEMRNIKEQVRNKKDESVRPSICLTGDLGNIQRNMS